MMTNEFIPRYRHLSDVELLKIIDNKSNYQAVAIEAAEFVFAERNLTQDQILQAKHQLVNSRFQTSEKGHMIENLIRA